MKHPTLEELPDVLTIHEVAEFMRISPAVAYEMAHRYRATCGKEGLPVVKTGARMMRVYKVELAKFLAGRVGHDDPDAA